MVSNFYVESIFLINKLHRLFIYSIKNFLYTQSCLDLNPTQALMIYHIGPQVVSIGETVAHSFYEGANPSYNVKKMIEAAYVLAHSSAQDRRVMLLSLTEKGQAVHKAMEEFFQTHAALLAHQGIGEEQWHQFMLHSRLLGKFWQSPCARPNLFTSENFFG